MAAELPRPGVEVIQVFRSVSPTVITPTLVPCVVGVCKQIVDVLIASAGGGKQLNPDALISLPGLFLAKAATGTPAKYTGLNALHLDLSFNNGASVITTFADVSSLGLSPTAVVNAINAAFASAGMTGMTAELVGTTQFRVRTLGVGPFQSITVAATTSANVLTAFGIGAGHTYAGITTYDGHGFDIPPTNFPDPRKNLSQLGIDAASVRAFLSIGAGGLQEATRTRSFLRRGNTNTAAVLTGTVDITTLTYPTDFGVKTVTLTVNGTAVLVTFGNPGNAAAVLSQINAAILTAFGTQALTATLGTSNHLVLTTALTTGNATVKITDGTLLSTLLGFTNNQTATGASSVEAVDDGNGDSLTPLLKVTGVNFTTGAGAGVLTGSVDFSVGGNRTALQGKSVVLSDGRAPQTITFPGSLAAAADVIAAINAVMGAAAGGGLVATLNGSSQVVLTSIALGDDGQVRVEGNGAVGGSDGAALLLGTAVTGQNYPVVARGAPFPAASGDEVYVDGVLVGHVTQVAPAAATDTLKIDTQVPINLAFGRSFYIIAVNLAGAATSTRPAADLIVGADGTATLKEELLRDTQGIPLATKANTYLAYSAVREDVSPLSANPGLLRFNDTDEVTASLAPVSPSNPLALGLFFALLNAPGAQVTGLGVDAISADSPFGTVEAFTRAAEFLEAFEVYGIAPLTHDQTVAQVFSTHASVMSEPANKGERVSVCNLAKPVSRVDKLVASGTNGNTVGSSGLVFDTGVASLPALLLNAGIDPTVTIPVSAGLFLDIVDDAKHYSITSVSGGVVTVKVSSFGPGDNDDNFYATTALNAAPLPAQLIEDTFAVRIRGAALTQPSGVPDKEGIAETYQAIGQTFLNRRFWSIVPDKCAATLDGIEQIIDGFYMASAIVGMIARFPPQQSFTNMPMAGFTRVIGSNDYFTEHQLNVIAAGGNYIIVQDAQGAPLTSRMALTSDMTSIETRTDSITKVVDFTAKFLRRGLRNFIGRFNITQSFLDSLGHIITGLLEFLATSGVLIGSHLNNIVQDASAPDTVLVDVTLDVPFPCNYIRLTLTV
jgi:hypothetical protein